MNPAPHLALVPTLRTFPHDPGKVARWFNAAIPERRPVVHFKRGHVLRIDHEHIAFVLRVKQQWEGAA